MLQATNISRSFAGVAALQDVSLRVDQGEIVGLIGPNGSGKTTLFNVITGLFPADQGQVRLDGRDITKLRPDQIARLGLARTFQTPRVLHRMTVWENFVSTIYAGSSEIQISSYDRMRLKELLEQSGLDERADELATNLTLQEQRKLELMRTLVVKPKFILLDEPAGGMTPAETEDMARLIRVVAAQGQTCVVIEHKIDMISSLCDRICVLNFGHVIADGPVDDVLQDEGVLEAYLGRQDVA